MSEAGAASANPPHTHWCDLDHGAPSSWHLCDASTHDLPPTSHQLPRAAAAASECEAEALNLNLLGVSNQLITASVCCSACSAAKHSCTRVQAEWYQYRGAYGRGALLEQHTREAHLTDPAVPLVASKVNNHSSLLCH